MVELRSELTGFLPFVFSTPPVRRILLVHCLFDRGGDFLDAMHGLGNAPDSIERSSRFPLDRGDLRIFLYLLDNNENTSKPFYTPF